MPHWAECILLFAVYSLLGWICESTCCSIQAKKFINRGFLNGPFCPIYGAGALLIIKLLAPFSANIIVLYLASLFLTSILEYFTGFAMEKLSMPNGGTTPTGGGIYTDVSALAIRSSLV